jgi:hypothetical protein
MSKKLTLNIDQDLYRLLKNKFKDDEQALNQFIIDNIRIALKATDSLPLKNDLESYLKKGVSGSRTYGVKGQGW